MGTPVHTPTLPFSLLHSHAHPHIRALHSCTQTHAHTRGFSRTRAPVRARTHACSQACESGCSTRAGTLLCPDGESRHLAAWAPLRHGVGVQTTVSGQGGDHWSQAAAGGSLCSELHGNAAVGILGAHGALGSHGWGDNRSPGSPDARRGGPALPPGLHPVTGSDGGASAALHLSAPFTFCFSDSQTGP